MGKKEKKNREADLNKENKDIRPDARAAEDIVDEIIREDMTEAGAAAAAEAAEDAETEDESRPAKDAEDVWKEKYTRQLAEFDNFRKRTEKEKIV